jgi:hypothetical protein
MINEELDKRSKRHGGFENVALTSQLIKRAIKHNRTRALLVEEEESLDMIAHKIGRLCHGELNRDDWFDIAGYALLVYRRLENEHNGSGE